MTENARTAALLKKWRLRYPDWWIHKVNERVRGGVPDVEIIAKGQHVKIEFKGPKTPVTELQRRTIAKLRKAGAYVFVCRFVGETGTQYKVEDSGTLALGLGGTIEELLVNEWLRT